MGLEGATEALRWGVNDLGGTLMEENISRMAGSQHGVRLGGRGADRRRAGRRCARPAQRRSTRSSRRTDGAAASAERYAGRDGSGRCARWSWSGPASLCGSAELCRSRRPARARSALSVAACGVCRTDLHVVDGELAAPKLPLVPGHEIVGTVTAGGASGYGRRRVGSLARLDLRRAAASAASGRENLCERARFTGYDLDGGYAEWAVADRALLLPAPGRRRRRRTAAPLLCAGSDRLPRAAAGRRRRAARPLRLRRRRAHPRPGRALRGPARLRVHPRRRRARRRRSRARSAPSGPAPGAPPEELDAAIIFAPGRRARPGGARGGRQGRHGRLRRHPHDRHPDLPLRAPLGRADAPLGRQPHPRATARSSWRWRRGCRCASRWTSPAERGEPRPGGHPRGRLQGSRCSTSLDRPMNGRDPPRRDGVAPPRPGRRPR